MSNPGEALEAARSLFRQNLNRSDPRNPRSNSSTQVREDGLVAVLKLDDPVPDADDVEIGDPVCGVKLHCSALRDCDPVYDRDRRAAERDGSDLEHVR